MSSGFDERPVRFAAGACLLTVQNEGVVLIEPRQELYALNSSAAFIWCSLEQGQSPAETSAAFCREFGVSRSRATRYVRDVLDRWAAIGLVVAPGRAEESIAGEARPVRKASIGPDLPAFAPKPVVDERRYRLLGTDFGIRFTDDIQVERVNPVLAHLGVANSDRVDVAVDIIGAGPRYLVYANREPVCSTRTDQLAPWIHSLVWRRAVDRYAYFMFIHSGVVGRDDWCGLLPAAPGGGKSILTAALIRAGYEYLSDEVALLEQGTYRVPPVPLSLSIKSDGWDALAPMYPALSNLAVHHRADGKILRYLPPPTRSLVAADAGSRAVRWIVFPRYDRSAPSALVPVGKAEALRRLLDECLVTPVPLSAENVQGLIDWIEGVDCYELPNSSSHEAVGLIKGLG